MKNANAYVEISGEFNAIVLSAVLLEWRFIYMLK